MPRVGESTFKMANKLVLVVVWASLVRAVSRVNSFPGGPPLEVVKLAPSKGLCSKSKCPRERKWRLLVSLRPGPGNSYTNFCKVLLIKAVAEASLIQGERPQTPLLMKAVSENFIHL